MRISGAFITALALFGSGEAGAVALVCDWGNAAPPARTALEMGVIRVQWTPRKIGENMAKDFTLPTLDGKGFTLSQHRGKVVLLDFWASWCPPCRATTPILIDLHRKYASRGLVIVGVNLQEGRSKVEGYKSQHAGMDYVNALDDSGRTGDLYRVRAIPTFFIVGHDGNIAWTRVGPDKDAMEAAVQAALKAAGK